MARSRLRWKTVEQNAFDFRLSIFGKIFAARFWHAIDSSPQSGLDSLDNLQGQRWGKAAKIGHGPATVIG